ncbi:MAG: DUF4249 domain-containing protein [Saprospiraceae bacterium]|nr:DUF4249 domain-containing protein [Saprospiraceae bacterium]
MSYASRFSAFPKYLLLFLLLWGCVDELDLYRSNDLLSSLVIEGRLVGGKHPWIEVNFSRLYSGVQRDLQTVGVKHVHLRNSVGDRVVIPELSIGRHFFQFDGVHFEVDTMLFYVLEIATFDGRTIESEPTQMLSVPSITSLTWEIREKERLNALGEIAPFEFVEVSVQMTLRQDEMGTKGNQLRYDFIKTFQASDGGITYPKVIPLEEGKTCWIKQRAKPADIHLFDGSSLRDVQIKIPVFSQEVGPEFAEGYHLEVVQQSMTAGAFEYWNQVSQAINRSGGLFETPAGRIRTNFVESKESSAQNGIELFGYFYATMTDTARLFIQPQQVGSPASHCPPPPPEFPPPDLSCISLLCCDCLSIEGSSSARPSYWPILQ